MKKLLAFVGLVLVGTVLWQTLSSPVVPTERSATPLDPAPANLAHSSTAAPAAPLRAAIAPATTARSLATGRLRVRARAARGDGTDLPLVGLFVLVWRGDRALDPLDGSALRLHTDERGEVALDLLPGPVHVEVPLESGAAHSTDVRAGDETVCEIVRPAHAVLRGIVVDTSDRPVADAEVWVQRGTYLDANLRPEHPEIVSRCAGHSDHAGRFEVAVLDHRENRISACREGYGESFGRYLSGARREVRLVLLADAAHLHGTVRDARGTPVPDALVTVRPIDTDSRRAADGTLLAGRVERALRTASDGTFRCRSLSPSRVHVIATAHPHMPAFREVQLGADAAAAVDLTLADGVIVVGTVRYADGTPAQAVVESRTQPDEGGHFSQCSTRADGSFALSYQPRRSFHVVAVTFHRTLASHAVVEAPPGLLRCDLVVDAQPVRGRVVDAAGRALRGCHVSAAGAGGMLASALTSDDGDFVLALPADAEVIVRAATSGAREPLVERHGVRAGQVIELVVPAAAIPRGQVLGRLLHADGSPAANHRVELANTARRYGQHTLTTVDGRFTFTDLVAGTLTLECSHGGHDVPLGAPFELAHAAVLDLGELRLPPLAVLIPEFVHQDGRPWSAEPPGVLLHDERGAQVAAAHGYDEGKWRVTALPGTYRVTINATDVLGPELTVRLQIDQPARLRIPLRIGRTRRLTCNGEGQSEPSPTPPVRFTVRDAAGQVVLQTEVTKLGASGFRVGNAA